MNLLYCIHSLYNPGGMERVLLNKVTWLKAHTDWDIRIVTTDQKDRQTFYPLPEGVHMTDLGINYSEDNNKNALRKITGYLRKRRKHRKRLTALLQQEKADIVVSLYPSESSFIPDIKDGSKKVLELHYCKFFRLQYGRNGLLGLADRWRTRQDEKIASRFDRFVVLTHEDRGYWGDLKNLEVIPNAAQFIAEKHSEVSRKRVIAVGRLDYQKGFDRLIRAWATVRLQGRHKDWQLDIFGQGEWQDMLHRTVAEMNLADTVQIHPPTPRIGNEYANSAMLVMSSRYEGFPMVMIEAMACGLPVVSFDCQCGPKDIIEDGINGLLVPDGDIEGLAEAIEILMDDEAYRRRLSANARKVTEKYAEETIMRQWMRLFHSLTAGNATRQ